MLVSPHDEIQSNLLERIIKNVVRVYISSHLYSSHVAYLMQKQQERCNEAIVELNKCVNVSINRLLTYRQAISRNAQGC